MPREGGSQIEFSDLVRDRLVLSALPPAGLDGKVLKEAGARDVLHLTWQGPQTPERHEDHVSGQFRWPSDIGKKNATVALLHGASGLALFNKRYFARFERVLIARDATVLASLAGLLRYRGKGRLALLGSTEIDLGGRKKRYLVLDNNIGLRSCRVYGPTGVAPLQILRALEGLDYVLLRSVEAIEAGRHQGDIDLLVSAPHLQRLTNTLSRSIGTYPIDAYTDSGEQGHSYKSVPFFMPQMASRILASAEVRPSGLRVPSPFWRYLAYAYSVLFHEKSEKIAPGAMVLHAGIFQKARYFEELLRLAAAAGLPAPRSFDDLETLLRAHDIFPGIDLIGFYSTRNPFLKERYLARGKAKPGLSVFFVRDFGGEHGPVPAIREKLKAHFEVLVEGPVTADNEAAILSGVRGGNWQDPRAPGGVARPVFWFVCWDRTPVFPTFFTRRKHFRVDNENIRVKIQLRKELASTTGKPLAILHSSDNSVEALEHLRHIGIADHPRIAELDLSRPP